MLSLTLKEGQYINIGSDVKVMFAGAEGGHIKVLIDAPKCVEIVREEKEETYIPQTKLSSSAKRKIDRIYKEERQLKKHKELIEKKKQELKQNANSAPLPLEI